MSKQSNDSEHMRAKWTKFEEMDLLSEYFDARRNLSLATDKGIKSKAWTQLTAELNAKNKRNLTRVSQYKSKLDRLMRDYDLYKEITNLSGCGICPDTDKPLLDDDVWEKLIEARPKQKGKLKEFRKNGFEHKRICSLIAGGS
ncbi:hypothetical protein PHYPSEUDO_002898 [Phytophthora pseudosyringae]|uniref:Myb/SANT-like domain-containing protein n=1 Tax=Phytophthora pseudosyringae TaxID=221518 RepID=A0A8T1VWD0_9STRA|nr:hypothetical protein PHYPSEUDO_002898 [Phytophthora pseudosyringae]